jgi:putative flippase GtrA
MLRAPTPQFLRFCIVGGMAFALDYALLEMMVATGISAPLARVFSIAIALQASYFLHGAFTFRDHQGYSLARWSVFISSNLIGAGVNYAVFLAVMHAHFVSSQPLLRGVALIAGTAVALFFNYWANRRFVFTRKDS